MCPAPTERPDRLFVYGTLKPGHENAHLLEPIGGTWQRGSVLGFLKPPGTEPGQLYPALTLDDHGVEVRGFVFSSARLPQHWRRLDEFEAADDYARVITTARLDDGSTVEAFVYVRGGAGAP